MTLYMIGIGLNDPKDISVKGLEAIKKSTALFLESYTSIMQCSTKDLEEFYGKGIIEADRDFVEKKADKMLARASVEEVAFLVVGDVFGATTHTDLYLRARHRGIKVKVINNAGVMNAIGMVGLELYKYGKTTSIPFPMGNYNPMSYYDVLAENLERGAHTLILLDIKADEARFMTVLQGAERLLEAEEKHKKGIIREDMELVGIARLGGSQVIRYGTLNQLMNEDFGSPPHCIIIPGKLHFVEEEALIQWKNL